MASINPTPPPNPQLAGITSRVPMPPVNGTLGDGTPFSLEPGNALTLGGNADNGFVVTANAGNAAAATGGGGTPGAGAQPAAPASTPAAARPAAAAAPVTAATPVTTTRVPAGGKATKVEATGFGRGNKNAIQRVKTGGASFSFPSFNSTRTKNTAPAITWGPQWKRVEKNGLWYMQAPNGTKAIPAVEYRITPKPADKVEGIKMPNGYGKKFPDGTIVVFDRNEGAYRLDPKGNKHPLPLGNHVFGGVRVRIFEASVVRTLDPAGNVQVFDSRGNASAGTRRGRMSSAIGGANAGAQISGGGPKPGKPDVGPGGKPGKLVGGGGDLTEAQLTQNVQHLTGVARGLLAQIRSGNVDPAKLAELQAQLKELPAGILQAAGAAGTMTNHLAPPGTPPGTTVGGVSGSGTSPATTSGGGVTAPTAGRDANPTRRKLAAGTSVAFPGTIPADLVGKQARFAQLPAAVQESIAKAFGSDQGAGAFKPDRMVAFSKAGKVSVVEGGDVYLKHQSQIRGAGPGEDLAMTMRPNRQPGSAQRATGQTRRPVTPARPTVAGGGGNGGGHVGHAHGAGATGNATGARRNRIQLFKPGGEMRHLNLGGINGSFTWKSLPPKGRAAILDFLRTASGDPAAKAFASRTGTGWTIDPDATIVVDAGFATFMDGLQLTRRSSPAPRPSVPVPTRPVVAGGGPTSQPVGHDATRPPVSGGGGTRPGGGTSPGTPPPAPHVADPGDHGHVGHEH